MPTDVMPLVSETPVQYLLSNGSRVASDVAVNFYTPGEILKIEIAGAILVIAVLVITYALWSKWNSKYKAWLVQKDIEERLERGEHVDPTEYPEPPKPMSRMVLYAIGALILLAGVAMIVIPS